MASLSEHSDQRQGLFSQFLIQYEFQNDFLCSESSRNCLWKWPEADLPWMVSCSGNLIRKKHYYKIMPSSLPSMSTELLFHPESILLMFPPSGFNFSTDKHKLFITAFRWRRQKRTGLLKIKSAVSLGKSRDQLACQSPFLFFFLLLIHFP